ncbi:MAG: InlB B-repeat-containing protein [Treponema sp.]|jgi:uncharacterized repeat protein (TIGR02543 family)|nr:InlB B-repeat-containing protein [Treponema sp.]
MKKPWLILITGLIALLASCPSPSGNPTNNPPVKPAQETKVVFDNTYGVCTALVYNDYRRRIEDKIAEVPAGQFSREIEWYPIDREPFYFAYLINLNGINDFTMIYVPKNGENDQTAVRIDADKTTNIHIPKLDETFSSQDQLLSTRSFLLLQNNSPYSFILHRGVISILPDRSVSAIVNPMEKAFYTINTSNFLDPEAGTVADYRLLRNADYIYFPASPGRFEPGHFYSYIYNGAILPDAQIPINLDNVVIKSYTVSFDANGGSGPTPAARVTKAGSLIKLPDGNGLSKNGHTFGGWNLASSGNEINYSANADYLATGNLTLFAKWHPLGTVTYTVTFDSNGGSVTAAQYTASGLTVFRPVNPIKTGYTFIGWYGDSGLSAAYDFSKPVTSNITLYAKWDITRECTVTFNANGGTGTIPAAQTVNSGSGITLPNGAGLSKAGYVFGGWSTDDAGAEPVYNADAYYTVTGDITLFAKWNAVVGTVTVSFDSNGGSSVASQTINSSGTATRPANPTRSGYTFVDWYGDSRLNTVYDFSTPVTGDITLYAKWDEDVQVDPTKVTSGADSGPGTLRQAITNAADGSTIVVDSSVGTIELTGRLEISKNLTIEGNGVTITRNSEWTTVDDNSQLLYTMLKMVTIKRIHFKGAKSTDIGSAIYNSGALNLESCIFSGNRTNPGDVWVNAFLYTYGSVTIKGCTFYKNDEDPRTAMIYNLGSLTLQGNLFYGSSGSSPIVYNNNNGGTVTSLGYNVVDMPYGPTGYAEDYHSGWYAVIGDKPPISDLPFSTTTFRLLPGSGAANVIATLPAGYPKVDFYGNPISNGAAAGAVQSTVNGTGFDLDLTSIDPMRGNVVVSPSPDGDGFVSGTVTLTASAQTGYEFSYWLVDGSQSSSVNPLALTINNHTKTHAVFSRVVLVTNFTDDMYSTTTPGTLRHALINAQDFDIIRFNGVTAGQTSIGLIDRLEITKNIIIDGNGVTITRDSAWTTVNDKSQLMYILNRYIGISVMVSRVHFKGGMAISGAALNLINYNYGYLTLESCIFSGNQSTTYGGAIFNSGNIKIKGCTFYGNSTDTMGGAIDHMDDTLTIEGNLFYGNSASNYPVVHYPTSEIVTSLGYNVVDVLLGTGLNQSGWEPAATDKTISEIPFSIADFKPLPGSGALNVITTLPADYPTVDFYGKPISSGAAAGAVQP